MSTQVKFRRGTLAQHATFVGAEGEITVVLDDSTLRVHDGVTAGGFAAHRETVLTTAQADLAVGYNGLQVTVSDDNSIRVYDGVTVGGFVHQKTSDILVALETAIFNKLLYVGALNASTIATNPATKFGIGTWSAHLLGKVPVGVGTYIDAGGVSRTYAGGDVEGLFEVGLTANQNGVHSHGITDPGHGHALKGYVANAGAEKNNGGTGNGVLIDNNVAGLSNSTTGITIQNSVGGDKHLNIQPSEAIYWWKRTA